MIDIVVLLDNGGLQRLRHFSRFKKSVLLPCVETLEQRAAGPDRVYELRG
jgi:hypothetical protein